MKYLVPAAEFATSLGRKPRSISDTLYRGGDLPPPIRIGRHLFFSQTDIDVWLDDKRQAAREEKDERERAVSGAIGRVGPRSGRPQKSSEPRAFERASGLASLNTARPRGVSDEQ